MFSYFLSLVCLYHFETCNSNVRLKLLINSSNIDDESKTLAQCTHRCFYNLISMLILAYLIVPLLPQMPIHTIYLIGSKTLRSNGDEMRSNVQKLLAIMSIYNMILEIRVKPPQFTEMCLSFQWNWEYFWSKTLFLIKNYQNGTVIL